MPRPRIRTIKPEMWQDERVGRLSRDARLLFVGLVTMADDEGRLRALPAAILGHVFPYDEDAMRKLKGWLGEVVDSGLVVAYEVASTPYIEIVGWRKHQVINKPTASELPPPPLRHVSGSAPVVVAERSDSHAGGRAIADRIGSGSGKEDPPSPPVGGTFPTRPVGKRERQIAAYQQQAQAFAVQHFPGASVGLVEHCADQLRLVGREPTVEALEPHVARYTTSPEEVPA